MNRSMHFFVIFILLFAGIFLLQVLFLAKSVTSNSYVTQKKKSGEVKAISTEVIKKDNSSATPTPTLSLSTQQINASSSVLLTIDTKPQVSTLSGQVNRFASPSSHFLSSHPSKTAYDFIDDLAIPSSSQILFSIGFETENLGKWTTVVDESQKISDETGKSLHLASGKRVELKGSEIPALNGELDFSLKLNSSGLSEEAPLFTWNFDGENFTPYIFEVSCGTDFTIYFSVYDEHLDKVVVSKQLSDPFVWHNFKITWDFLNASELKLFLDNALVSSSKADFKPQTHRDSSFFIGGGFGGRGKVNFDFDKLILRNFIVPEVSIEPSIAATNSAQQSDQ